MSRLWRNSPEIRSLKNYQYSTGQTFHENLAPVLVIISGNSLVFSRKVITSAGFYRYCAPGASAPVVVIIGSPRNGQYVLRFRSFFFCFWARFVLIWFSFSLPISIRGSKSLARPTFCLFRRPPDYPSNLCPPKTFAIWFFWGCFGPPSCCFLI